ncbi:phytase [Phenylobacterium sp.]|uniref:phytase n=1 Tax=Phenylobacterium sp. TaxID=1871053 RepID=UPI0025D131AB|nr:phytase [Phenylobacterium sp.]MBX3484114.1 phytase [Phenylobacterium sp.]MCW5758477.1 phytase [Phenylobacterium sp.]
MTPARFPTLAAAAAAMILSGAAGAAEVAPTHDLPFPEGTPTVVARVETAPVARAGDAADDPAIWVNPKDPALSAVIGTDKKGGLYVYDLAGKPLQFLANGRMNNVDLRAGFRLGGREVVLVTASDRTNKAIAILTLDPETRQLADVADGVQESDLSDPYGLCMYRDRKGGETYVFVNDPTGLVRQWRLVATPAGKVRAEVVRSFALNSQVEGCVADDETGALYIGEEDVGLWRFGAAPNAGDRRRLVAAIKDNPMWKADFEGVGLWAGKGGRGYIVVSSQGDNTYAVFDRGGRNRYRGSFAIAPDPASGIDGVSETDGLDVVSAPLPGFPRGLLVTQDGYNVSPSENQNFKFVSWADVATQLKLD